jgi:hypothetical protein
VRGLKLYNIHQEAHLQMKINQLRCFRIHAVEAKVGFYLILLWARVFYILKINSFLFIVLRIFIKVLKSDKDIVL